MSERKKGKLYRKDKLAKKRDESRIQPNIDGNLKLKIAEWLSQAGPSDKGVKRLSKCIVSRPECTKRTKLFSRKEVENKLMPDAVASEMKRVRTEASRQMKLQQANCERNSQKSSESHKSSQPGWSLASQNSSKPPLTLTSNSGESTEEEEQSYRKKRKTDWDTSSESESEERRKRQQKQADSNNAWTGGHVLDAYDEVLPKLQWYLDILPVFFPRKDGDQKRNAYRALRQIWYTMDEVESERLANSPEYFGFECIEKSPSLATKAGFPPKRLLIGGAKRHSIFLETDAKTLEMPSYRRRRNSDPVISLSPCAKSKKNIREIFGTLSRQVSPQWPTPHTRARRMNLGPFTTPSERKLEFMQINDFAEFQFRKPRQIGKPPTFFEPKLVMTDSLSFSTKNLSCSPSDAPSPRLENPEVFNPPCFKKLPSAFVFSPISPEPRPHLNERMYQPNISSHSIVSTKYQRLGPMSTNQSPSTSIMISPRVMQSSIYKHFGMPVVSSHEQNTRNVWRPHSTDSSSSKRRVQSYRSTSVCQSSLRPMSPDFSGAVDSSFQFISPVRISQHHQNRKATFYIESPHNIDRPTTSLSRRLTIESPQFFQPIGHTVQSYQLMNKSYDHSPRNASLRSLATYMSSPESLSKAEEKVMTLWRKPRWQS